MTTTTTYSVHGMSCGHCVSSITTALVDVEGVHAIEVSLERAEVRVETDPTVSHASVRAAINGAGYEVR